MRRAGAGFIVLALIAVLAAGCGSGAKDAGADTNYAPRFQAPDAASGLVFKDPELQFQLLRALGSAAYGAADIGECLVTAMQVDEAAVMNGDFSTWYGAWNNIAERLNNVADNCLAKGDRISARDAYFRSETYYRMAEFYLHGNPSDPRIKETSGNARECFEQAGKLLNPPVEAVEIKYEQTTLPGYFYSVDGSGKRRPLVIMQTGFDGTQEELYAGGASALLERGYNCLTFEGPGQGEVLREQGLHFRPDWEKVVTPVVDYAVSRKDVDPKKVGLWGISMGGYLTLRAAAFEHRIAALIADPGMDMAEVLVDSMGPFLERMSQDPNFKPDKSNVKEIISGGARYIDEAMQGAMSASVSLRWFVQNGMYAFGAKTPSDYMLKMLEYTLGGVSGKIKCPTLVCNGEQDEKKYPGMAKGIYDSLTCPKKYVLFTNAEGAGAHCQLGASRYGNQVKLDWIGGEL